MNIDPRDKMCDRSVKPDGVHPKSEKYILRKAFDTPDRPFLPEAVLWRQKEQFSDGVGYDWVDGLKVRAPQRAAVSLQRVASSSCIVAVGSSPTAHARKGASYGKCLQSSIL